MTNAKQHPLHIKWRYIQNCVNYIDNRDGRNARMLKLTADWQNFWSFAEDIEAKLGLPKSGEELVRKDMSKGWTLSNLQYTKNKKQKARRQRRCSWLKYKGKKLCAKELAEKIGLHYSTLLWRMERTSNIKLLTLPAGEYGKKKKR